jgi:hypothetical protein
MIAYESQLATESVGCADCVSFHASDPVRVCRAEAGLDGDSDSDDADSSSAIDQQLL